MSPTIPLKSSRRVGVLLVNLGTPDATDYFSMRRYLGISVGPAGDQISPAVAAYFAGIILTFRPQKIGPCVRSNLES